MSIYKKMYFKLFNDVTNVISNLNIVRSEVRDIGSALKGEILEEQIKQAIIDLRKAQQKTDENTAGNE